MTSGGEARFAMQLCMNQHRQAVISSSNSRLVLVLIRGPTVIIPATEAICHCARSP